VIVSGTLADHGMAVMTVREGLSFRSSVRSDTAALNGLVAEILNTCGETHALRDPTRGGLATTLNEFAVASKMGIKLDDEAIPVRKDVAAACEILGIDPMYVANEGKLVAVVPAEAADAVLAASRSIRDWWRAGRRWGPNVLSICLSENSFHGFAKETCHTHDQGGIALLGYHKGHFGTHYIENRWIIPAKRIANAGSRWSCPNPRRQPPARCC